MFDLSGKVGIVTGAGVGIGRGIALGLAEHGADLLLCDLNGDDVEETARQVQALGRIGDVALGISTSGASPNVLGGLEAARVGGLATIALTGPSGPVADLADVAIRVPSELTQHVQEAHLAIEHVLCDLVERSLFDPAFEPA